MTEDVVRRALTEALMHTTSELPMAWHFTERDGQLVAFRGLEVIADEDWDDYSPERHLHMRYSRARDALEEAEIGQTLWFDDRDSFEWHRPDLAAVLGALYFLDR